jgi:hypothetical protein
MGDAKQTKLLVTLAIFLEYRFERNLTDHVISVMHEVINVEDPEFDGFKFDL